MMYSNSVYISDKYNPIPTPDTHTHTHTHTHTYTHTYTTQSHSQTLEEEEEEKEEDEQQQQQMKRKSSTHPTYVCAENPHKITRNEKMSFAQSLPCSVRPHYYAGAF